MDAIKDYHIIIKILHTHLSWVSVVAGDGSKIHTATLTHYRDGRCRGLEWIGNPFC